MERDRPFVVPGFGCSYWEEAHSHGPGSDLELRFVRHGPGAEEGPELFRGEGNVLTVLTALEAGRGHMRGSSGESYPVDSRMWLPLFSPSHRPDLAAGFRSRGFSSRVFLLKLIVLRFHEPSFLELEREFGVSKAMFFATVRSGEALAKSFWIEEVLHRMIFERCLAGLTQSLSARFCETELLKEVYYSALKQRGEAKNGRLSKDEDEVSANAVLQATIHHSAPQLQKALRYIEEHLHEDLDTEVISKAAALSPSSLLRLFKQHLGTTPVKHVWRRRLQEARLLLLSGGYSVLEVAHHARFASGTAFSKAFHAEFGETPKSVSPN